MERSQFTQRLLCVRAAIATLCFAWGMSGVAAAAEAANTISSDQQRGLITELAAVGPHPSIADHARVVSRLVGAWDVEYTDFKKDGRVTQRSGQLIFGWVLDGRAIQDLWVVFPSEAQEEREVYTDLFYLDAKSGAWRTVFVDPQEASVATFIEAAAGDGRLVLESRDLVPKQVRRWSYSDFRPGSFVYRDEASTDGGKTWKLRSEYHMTRRGETPRAQ